ncbi:carbon-nitrogen hydrolase family protein [Pseudoalteromonas sp. T1lg65]|uniref:carbon-nitrogen hydrolase family protein n=1 Tax=Pseudoalteromonas sp. T1lg65 TaxID=2077101 RepID=UPI003F79B156
MADIIALQMCSAIAPEENFNFLKHQLEALSIRSETLVCLPEAWLSFCANAEDTWSYAGQTPYYLEQISALCKQYKVWIAAGTIATQADEHKYHAASYLFNKEGQQVARYNKIHLFDAKISDSVGQYQESNRTLAGNEVVVVRNTPFGNIGLSVCYDLRFSGLFQVMREQGAEIFVIPSAFTRVTGDAHWQVLLQARAIETQCYVVAAAQSGVHENGRETYGRSLIISPWGEILEDAGRELGCIRHALDRDYIEKVRSKMPVASHNRFRSEFL